MVFKKLVATAGCMTSGALSSNQSNAWLIEWPQTDNMPARWWHPVTGWMLDANKATRFSRQEDAEGYIKTGCFVTTVIATQHSWCSADETKDE